VFERISALESLAGRPAHDVGISIGSFLFQPPGRFQPRGARVMQRRFLGAALMATAALASASQVSAAEPDVFGVWRNPKNTVHLEIKPCGASACGYVIWASAKAQADARHGSGKELIGMQLLRDFAPAGHSWRGKVFVPDLNMTLGGAARPIDAGHLEAKGCLVGGLLCKSQVWSRLSPADS
jgi:uncharacterized protein (DUF2147 family)